MRGVISPKLAPFLAQVNEAIAQVKQQNLVFSAEQVRAGLNNLSAFLVKSPHISLVIDKYLTNESHKIPVRIYHPSPQESLPVLIHFHGGGHMCGSIDLYDPISRQLAKITHCIVICVDYRLSPEYPYPLGIDDCQQLLVNYKQLLNGLNYGAKLYIVGDSAGGAICTTLAMQSLTNNEIKIDKQILIYPSVDYTMSGASITENGQGFLLEQDKIKWYFQAYFQHKNLDSEQVKLASPLFGCITDKIPETLIITGGCDPLRDEGLAYQQALINAGVRVKSHHFEHMPHAFMLLQSLVEDECEQCYQLFSDFLK
ncbi:MAG: acetyl esterase [Alteromonadaceae bacterium]|jgi:acetyl esterase